MRFLILALLLLTGVAWADPPVATTWDGPVGLFTMPTARTFESPTVAVQYTESRFGQETFTTQSLTTAYTGSVTVAVSPKWEVYGQQRHEVLTIAPTPGNPGTLNVYDGAYATGGVKYVLRAPSPQQWGVAAGVADICDKTKNLEGFDTGRGTRTYLAATKDWLTVGATYTRNTISASAGAEFTVGDNIGLIGEYTMKPVFPHSLSGVWNRGNCNIGLRMRPQEIPNAHVDLAASGDGTFNFTFAAGFESAMTRPSEEK